MLSGSLTPDRTSLIAMKNEVEMPPFATTAQFRGRKNIDYSLKEANDQRLGNAGELAVLSNEKEDLVKAGRADLAKE